MATINYAAKEISVKIVYYGPGLSGKTTNLQIIHRKIPKGTRGDMVSLATETDRTLFFDFLPLDLGKIRGFTAKFQLYTVPGQVYYNATRKLVLRGVDGIVFVADSAADKMEENLESFKNMEDNLAEYGYKRENIPTALQYNKRDLSNALPISYITQKLNKYGLESHEAVANKGEGVFETLKLIGKLVIDQLNQKYASKKHPAGAKRPAPAQKAPAKPDKPAPVQEPKKETVPPLPKKPVTAKEEVKKQPPPVTPPKITPVKEEVKKETPPVLPPKEKPLKEEVKKELPPSIPPKEEPVKEEVKKEAPAFTPPTEMPKHEVKSRELSQFPSIEDTQTKKESFAAKRPVRSPDTEITPTPPKQTPMEKSPYQFDTINLEPMAAEHVKLPERPKGIKEEYSSLKSELDHYYGKIKKELPEQVQPDDFGSYKNTSAPQPQAPQSGPPQDAPGANAIPSIPEPSSESKEQLSADTIEEKEQKPKSKKTFLGKLFNRDTM
jgi:signal recognition particle receptor subunit beta